MVVKLKNVAKIGKGTFWKCTIKTNSNELINVTLGGMKKSLMFDFENVYFSIVCKL